MDKYYIEEVKKMLDAKYNNMKDCVLYRRVPVTKLRKRHLVVILAEMLERQR